eukprot:CAMPEP_0180136326 /NCGR_PEP_ID=MMETSP0986-20121125/11432_1 /TAXON_ID=697907 /ORGANISM="non described non described, Strain CCMP2293" /LENGTH=76 /DNA_ID=CAMNT_0022077339 /DNA_START=97 /DNA_END=327 /DNA_ORIENTATION=-
MSTTAARWAAECPVSPGTTGEVFSPTGGDSRYETDRTPRWCSDSQLDLSPSKFARSYQLKRAVLPATTSGCEPSDR